MWLLFLAFFLGEPAPFISTWSTTTAYETITLPLNAIYGYSLQVDWGDGFVVNYTSSIVQHTYVSTGYHSISITGTLPGFCFNYGGDNKKLYAISQWGEFIIDSRSSYSFSGCSFLRSLPSSGQPSVVGTNACMDYMFSGCTSLNSPIAWDLTGVITLEGFLSGATTFNSALSLNTATVSDMSSFFNQAISFNQVITFNTTNVQDMSMFFAQAWSFNKPLTLNTNKVTNMYAMFQNASSFNSLLAFSSTRAVTNMSRMFQYAGKFNTTLTMDTSSVTDFSWMFSQSGYNLPVNFLTSSATSFEAMFYDAPYFNQPVYFSTSKAKTMRNMFGLCAVFNQSLSFDTVSVTDMSQMFYAAFAFNQMLYFDTRSVTTMRAMFLQATDFNQPLFFDTSKVTDMTLLFGAAYLFNQNLNWNTSAVTTMAQMFYVAEKFNKQVNFDTRNVVDMSGMFAYTSDFNQTLNFSTRNVLDFSGMFQYSTYNKPLNFDTSKATNMNNMFMNAHNFTQNMSAWSVKSVANCSNFCDTCGLPHFEQCSPCTNKTVLSASNKLTVCSCPSKQTCAPIECVGPAYSGAAGKCVCNDSYVGTVNYFANTTFGCGPPGPPDLCNFTQISTGLQSSCVPPVTVPPTPGGVIISPAVNITRDNSTSTSSGFVFTLPINANFTHRGVVVQGCQSTQVRCEWQDPVTLGFLTSGCELTQEDVSLGGGVVGAQCTCDHLTVFALVLRTEKYQQPLCAAVTEDYVMLGLYAVLSVLIVVQMMRLAFAKSLQRAFLQHAILLLACVLRIIFIVIKSVVHSVAGLVFIGLLPSALTMMLFIHILVTWASIQIFSMTISPFAKLRLPFVAVVTLVLVGTIAIVVAVGATDDESVQQAVVVNGSYALAALYASVCIMVIFAGFGLRRLLITSSSRSLHSSASDGVRVRVLVSTIGISLCLFVAACLWVAAVQSDILASDTASLAVSIAFYAVDWISLCMLAVMFATSVKIAVVASKKSSHSPLSS